MGLETGTYVSDLVSTNPISTDPRSQGDDHLRLIKAVLQASFPNSSRAFRGDRYTAKTSAYTVADTDQNNTLACATAGGAFLITLPTTLTTSHDGFKVRIVKSDSHANALTVGPSSGTINGETTLTLSNIYDAVICEWTGTAWIATQIPYSVKVRAITADATLTEVDLESVLLVTPASANATLTLPAVANYKGRTLYVKLLSATYDCILDGSGAETIDGATTYTLATQYEAAALVCDGSAWHLLDRPTDFARLAIANTFAALATFTSGLTANETVTIADDFVAPPVTLTDDVTIAWDMSTGMNFTVTLGGNRTLGAPTGDTAGQTGLLFVVQDGTGSRTLTWNAAYKFPNGADEKPSPTASSTTCYEYYVRGADDIIVKKRWMSASNSIGFYKEYDMGAVNDNSNTNQAHGLGRYPAGIEVYIECDSADANYSVGDRVPIAGCGINNSDTGIHPWMSTTSVGAVIANNVYVYNKSTFVAVAITEADWSLIFRVYE